MSSLKPGAAFPKRHPARLRYRILELQRWREKRGLTFNLHPKFWPFDAEAADRLVIAIARTEAISSDCCKELGHGLTWKLEPKTLNKAGDACGV